MDKRKKRTIISLIVFFIVLIGATAVMFLIKMKGNKKTDTMSFQNKGKTYEVVLSGRYPFRDSTAVSNVNNADGLELNYNDTYITIQRFPGLSEDLTVEDFEKSVDGAGYPGMNQTESGITITNPKIKEYKIYEISTSSAGKVFSGCIYYFKTDKAFYKVLLSGSEQRVIDNNKYFINDMLFTE